MGFLVTSLHPEAHQESPHYNKKHSYHPGNPKGFRSSVSEDLTTQEITKVLGAVCVRNQKYVRNVFLIIS